MSKKITLMTFAAFASCVPMLVTGTQLDSTSKAFYKNSEEGWYWYNEKKPVKVDPLLKKIPLQEKKIITKKGEPKEVNSLSKEPPFSAKWVRESLPKYKDLMWSNPTPENVKAYFLLQRFAIDRSQKVADVAKSVIIGNVLLDESMRRPIANFGTPYVDRQAAQNTDKALKEISKKAGLFFFFKSNCQYCEAQTPLIGHLKKDGFDVIAISIDGGDLKNNPNLTVKKNTGQAEALGIKSVPAVFLVSPQGEFDSLGQGLLSFSDLRSRILLSANRRGWIDSQTYQSTKPIINSENQRDLSTEVPKLLKVAADPYKAWGTGEESTKIDALNQDEKYKLTDKNGFIPPNKLIDFLETTPPTGQSDLLQTEQ